MMMEGSGIEKLLETVYGANTVNQMLGGKSISRALREHILVDGALKMKIIASFLPESEENDEGFSQDSGDEGRLSRQEVCDLEELFENTGKTDLFSEKLEYSTTLKKLSNLIGGKAKALEGFRTAKLWLQYMNYIDIMKYFIPAGRTGSWQDHLKATSKMLNLFAASGHHNYTKSARLYLR